MEEQAKRRRLPLAKAFPTHQNSYRISEKTERWMAATWAGDGGAELLLCRLSQG